MDTDQIFMTYVENDNKSTTDDNHQEFKHKREMIDKEIEIIKNNLQLPTIETEEDDKTHDENDGVRCQNSAEEFKFENFCQASSKHHKYQWHPNHAQFENFVAEGKDNLKPNDTNEGIRPKSKVNPL